MSQDSTPSIRRVALITGRAGRLQAVRARFPAGRWGTPDDAARAVAWLTSDDGRWVTGQVLDSEGGFRRGA